MRKKQELLAWEDYGGVYTMLGEKRDPQGHSIFGISHGGRPVTLP